MSPEILERKIAAIVMRLSEKLNIDEIRALDVFYASKTYQRLADSSTKLYLMSDAYIIDDLMMENRAG